MPTFYKTLDAEMRPCHGGQSIPFKIGVWTPAVDPIPCTQGYHVCTANYLLEWIAPRVFEVETAGRAVSSDMKHTVSSIRLVRELSFGIDGARALISDVLARLPARPADPRSAILTHNLDNNQIAMTAAMAWAAADEGVEIAVQIAPKRVAQALAWMAYGAAIEAAWDSSKGEAPESFWLDVERQASAAKAAAHDIERARQQSWLLDRLGIAEGLTAERADQ